jgi:hypothetical protein
LELLSIYEGVHDGQSWGVDRHWLVFLSGGRDTDMAVGDPLAIVSVDLDCGVRLVKDHVA